MGDYKTVKIPVVMSKSEEQIIICEFINALPENSYLAGILEGMKEYCVDQIECDYMISPIDTIKTLRGNLDAANKEIYDLKKQPKGASPYEVECMELRKIRKDLEEALSKRAKSMDELEEEHDNLLEKCQKMDDTITRLKARLFDVMESQGLLGM